MSNSSSGNSTESKTGATSAGTIHASPGSAGGGSGGGGGGGSNISISASTKQSLNTWFTLEIQQMMHGMGDSRHPLLESATLIQEIVQQQMIRLLYEAADVAVMRGARFIGIEDLLFLMRKDKVKLRRLVRYLELKDMKMATLRGPLLEEEDTSETGQAMTRRKKICYDFLSIIDQTGELLALFDDEKTDDIKQARLIRAERQTRSMDAQEYMAFCEARQTTFSRKYKIQKFKDWLMSAVSLDMKPNQLALEVLSYLVYEVIAQVVDLALIVKQDMKARIEDPLLKSLPNVCFNYHELAAPGGLRGYNPDISSPTISPPSTPTQSGSQISLSQSSSSLSSSQGSSTSTSKSKLKKRKKSGGNGNLDYSTSHTILPTEIQEAMRRYGQDVGPFEGITKISHGLGSKRRLLCC